MFDILFGWRKASKCKKLIRRVQCRLKLLKNKRCSIVRQLRQDAAQLLKNGHEQSAFNRIEQLFKDESIVTVYDLLDHFCEFIIIHLSYIRRHKDCPNDINEAVSSLIFASARCGDLPELQVIRKLFGERYGHRFATVAVELLHGNLVNPQIKENLSIKSVSDDVKYRLMDEIARSCLQSGPLAIEYCSELQLQQANESSMHQKEEKVEKHIQMNSPYEFTISGQSTTESWSSSIATNAFTLELPEQNMAAESSSESSTQLPEEMIYLDDIEGKACRHPPLSNAAQAGVLCTGYYDIEEFQSPTSKDVKCQDQRLFMFKSPVLHKRDKFDYGLKEGYIEQSKAWNENVNSRSPTKCRRAAGKRLRRRSVSQESSSVKDVECALYYGKSFENSPNQSCKSRQGKSYQKNIPMDGSQESLFIGQERVEHPCCMKRGSNFKSGKIVNGCSLEHPCYFSVSDYKEDWGSPPWKQKRRMTTLEEFQTHYFKEGKLHRDNCHCCCSCKGEQHDQEMGLEFLPQKPRLNFQTGATMINKLTYADHWPNKQGKEVEGEEEDLGYLVRNVASICCSSKLNSPWTRKETETPYLRAMTMPPERPRKDSCTDNIVRSNSFPFQQPCRLSHVHPKLPDYDELTDKFRALKKPNLQNKQL